MKWNLKSKRWVTLLLVNLIWVAVGFIAGMWDVFSQMILPIVGLNGAYIIGESWRPSGSSGA